MTTHAPWCRRQLAQFLPTYGADCTCGGNYQPDEPADDDICPDCLPRSQCGACADDRRFHEERDNRLEEKR